ncbi:MAG TPA: phosphopantothenate/pantothenate synthetase [Candidatus Poseidoniales archaeon]|nr:MAG TPA: phosphopantothenate/pantothenate synthetase [Candidatus Poseidoniales archaeon]
MNPIAADPSHPRYASLLRRHLIEEAAAEGLLAGSAMIAHGRGEAYDYLLGEQTTASAASATKEAYARLRAAKRPVISVNGNTVALAGRDLLHVASMLSCPVEVNIFYRTQARMDGLIAKLESWCTEDGLQVEVLGRRTDGRIDGLEGPRAQCEAAGIASADVVLVPLEDGDRCEALVAMGKTVLVVDLNPLSRTARTATVTIVDEVGRTATALKSHAKASQSPEPNPDWDNMACLQASLDDIAARLSQRFA